MKKFTVILISLFLIVGFGILVYIGLKHSRGVPVSIEKPKERVLLTVPFIDKTIDLSKGISPEIWEKLEGKEIELMYQVTVLPWPKSLVPKVKVKAFYNKKEIYFYMSWQDETEDRSFEEGIFSDACAIMFPLEKKVQPQTIMMGFLGKVNIWQWKASQDKEYWVKESQKSETYSDFYYPFEDKEVLFVSKDEIKSAVNDLVALRVGTVTPKEKQIVEGRGIYEKDKKMWQVVFKRKIEVDDKEFSAEFVFGEKKTIAFAVWDGSKGDRGGRKSISDWVEMEIKGGE